MECGPGRAAIQGGHRAPQVCRAAGYHEHALFVAQAAGEPAVYLDVLLADCAAFDEALAYLEGLPRTAAAEALKKYGKVPSCPGAPPGLYRRPPPATPHLTHRIFPLGTGGSARGGACRAPARLRCRTGLTCNARDGPSCAPCGPVLPS